MTQIEKTEKYPYQQSKKLRRKCQDLASAESWTVGWEGDAVKPKSARMKWKWRWIYWENMIGTWTISEKRNVGFNQSKTGGEVIVVAVASMSTARSHPRTIHHLSLSLSLEGATTTGGLSLSAKNKTHQIKREWKKIYFYNNITWLYSPWLSALEHLFTNLFLSASVLEWHTLCCWCYISEITILVPETVDITMRISWNEVTE